MHEKAGLRRFIGKPGRGLLAAVLAALLALTASAPAGAESPGTRPGFSGEASLSLGAWPDLSPGTLSAMQDWLDGLKLRLYSALEKSGFALLDGGQDVLKVQSRQSGGESLLTLAVPGALAPTEYVGTPGQPPLKLLFGAEELPDLRALADALPRASEALLTGLAPYGKPQEKQTRLKNVGRAESRVSYSLTQEEAGAWWQGVMPEMRAIWREAAAGLPAAWQEEGDQLLGSLRFTGRLSVIRFLDAEGRGLGFQVTGGLEALGQRRKLDLTAGFREETGLYLKLLLPAARGRDRLEALITLDLSGARARGDYSLTLIASGDKRVFSGRIDLALGGQIRGDLTVQARFSGDTALKRDHRLTPDFTLSGEEIAGSLRWTETGGGDALRDMTLNLRLTAGGAPEEEIVAQARVDLRNADEAARGHAARQAAEALLPYLRAKLLALPQDTRLLVLHDWGRVRRALGEAPAPGTPETETDSFTVSEGADTQAEPKEENP